MTTRRHVLQVLAAAPLAACGGADLPDPAAAWRDPGAGETDPRRFALAHAILAPNPHNTQPWLVELDGADGMTLSCDLDRRLPATDPIDRQITLGCGCFLQLYLLAARAQGFTPQITPFPEGEPVPRLDQRPLVRVRLGERDPARQPHPLFAAIGARRTNRNIYDIERIPREEDLARIANTLGAFLGAARWTTNADRVAQIRDLVWRAFDVEMRTEAAAAETFEWLRFGRAQIAEHRDGLAIDGPMIPLLNTFGMFNRDAMIDPDSFANKTAADDWRAKAESAPAFMWLTSTQDTPIARLEAGMAYARVNLAATTLGLAMHPWSQALQEYPEMEDLYAEARTLLEIDDGQTLQMLVRVGYADPSAPSARRGLDAILAPTR